MSKSVMIHNSFDGDATTQSNSKYNTNNLKYNNIIIIMILWSWTNEENLILLLLYYIEWDIMQDSRTPIIIL